MNARTHAAGYYCGYTPIRNLLRKYSPSSVLESAIAYLVEPTEIPLDQIRKQPWTVLLLVKWAFIDEQANGLRRPPIPPAKFRQALQHAHELQDRTPLPSDYEHVSLFFRTIAFQQFLYQRHLNSRGIARQEVLFADVPDNHWFRTQFLAQTGVPVADFNSFSFALWAAFVSRRNAITEQWMSPLYGAFPRELVTDFFGAVSIPLECLHARLAKEDKTGRKAAEYYEQTPFLAFPLVKIGAAYYCTYSEILVRSLEHFVYDTLKKTDGGEFNARFGPRFERYVEQVLSYAALPMIKEEELKKALPGTGGVIDFLIVDNDTNILLEAKGVEMAARGKVAHLREVVQGATRSSLIKAVRQAHEVQSRLASMDGTHPVLRLRNPTFLLAVTYKELYIGNGLTLADTVGRAALDDIFKDYPAEIRIPLERMYFLTIEELELLMEGIKDDKFTLTEILERAMRDDAEPMSRKFAFSQHLAEALAGGTTKLPVLAQAEQRLTSAIENALRAAES